jgi:hypothetical protein
MQRGVKAFVMQTRPARSAAGAVQDREIELAELLAHRLIKTGKGVVEHRLLLRGLPALPPTGSPAEQTDRASRD